jgi:hypothetical protein
VQGIIGMFKKRPLTPVTALRHMMRNAG